MRGERAGNQTGKQTGDRIFNHFYNFKKKRKPLEDKTELNVNC